MTTDDLKEMRIYAWSYFSLHADQRMKMFNFFLILSGLILSAFIALEGTGKIGTLLSIGLAITAVIFWQLEERTRELVKNGEEALRFLDAQLTAEPMSDGSPHYLQLIERDDYHRRIPIRRLSVMYPLSYSCSFRIVYLLVGISGVLLTVLSLI